MGVIATVPELRFMRQVILAAISSISGCGQQPLRLPSLPLDPPRRLRGHVVDHAVDAAHLVDDAGRHSVTAVRFEPWGSSSLPSWSAKADPSMMPGASPGTWFQKHAPGLDPGVVNATAEPW